MEIMTTDYIDHFDQFGCRYYKFQKEELAEFNAKDTDWLTNAGLPDAAVPFFFFDVYIAYLRDVSIPGMRKMLGTAFEPASHHYLFVDSNDEVFIQMEQGHMLFVNSSVTQLCQSILFYSQWLEEQEKAFATNISYEVPEDCMFNLYYMLREIDKKAFAKEASIWPQISNAEINFLADQITTEGS